MASLAVSYDGDRAKSVALEDGWLVEVVSPPSRGMLADDRRSFALRRSPSLPEVVGLSVTEPPRRQLVALLRVSESVTAPLEIPIGRASRIDVVRDGVTVASFPLADAVRVRLTRDV